MQITGNSASQSGLQLLREADQKIAKNAQQIASSTLIDKGQTTQPLTESLIHLTEAEHSARIGAKVIAAADEALGTLIDIKV